MHQYSKLNCDGAVILMMKPEDGIKSSNWDVRHMTCPGWTSSSGEDVNTAVNVLQRGVSCRTTWSEPSRGKRVVGRGIVLRNQAIHGLGKGIAGIVAVATEAASDGIEVLMGSFHELCLEISFARLISQRPPDSGFGILELINSVKSGRSSGAVQLTGSPSRNTMP